jgi:superfamily I DNA/RNA helicase
MGGIMSCNSTDLNDQQRTIINHLTGALLVLAPVGTGKTRVLDERVIAAVNGGFQADRILCLTFTNRAAQEMRNRLTAYNADVARAATLKTFHALCAQLLHSEADIVGLPADFVIYDDHDCQELITDVFDINHLYRPDRRCRPDAVRLARLAPHEGRGGIQRGLQAFRVFAGSQLSLHLNAVESGRFAGGHIRPAPYPDYPG